MPTDQKDISSTKNYYQPKPHLNPPGYHPEMKLAQAYVLWQKYNTTLNPAEALSKGTLFPELYQPYHY